MKLSCHRVKIAVLHKFNLNFISDHSIGNVNPVIPFLDFENSSSKQKH